MFYKINHYITNKYKDLYCRTYKFFPIFKHIKTIWQSKPFQKILTIVMDITVTINYLLYKSN